MIVISHRGYWKSESEKNTDVAFDRSFSKGFGTETDFRDYKGELVMSHDVADENCMTMDRFFAIYKKDCDRLGKNLLLALNVKADGLQKRLKLLLEKHDIKNYFVFDMSIPEHIQYVKNNITAFTRLSEYEKYPVLYDESSGLWIDCFVKEWVTEEILKEHLEKGKFVALVSPDLHKRDHLVFWEKLSRMKIIDNDRLILCTDLPEDAERFFHGKD